MFFILLYKAQPSYTPKKLTLLSYIGCTHILHTTVHYCTVLYSTTLPFLLCSSFLLTPSLLACSSLSSAKTSEKVNTRKVARALTCRQAGVICRRLPSKRNRRGPLASTQRANVCACSQVVITTWSAIRNEIYTFSHASESRCFATVINKIPVLE